MFGHFYHESFKRYVAVFGTMFNNMTVKRYAANNSVLETYKVPLAYSPREKMLARIQQDPTLENPVAIQLPRMGFEMSGINYAPERKLITTNRFNAPATANSAIADAIYTPVPYDIQFRLSIYAKQTDDAMQIVEQILPHFTPDWTNTVQIVDKPLTKLDIPINLLSVSFDDNYESTVEDKRMVIWTLDFTMQAFFFGPAKEKRLIQFVKTRTYPQLEGESNTHVQITVQPGLTANGQPTTDIDDTIPYAQIAPDDDWAFIVQTSIIS